MAMASFCGMEIDTGLAESCLSLLRDRRNCLEGQRSELEVSRPRSVALCSSTMDATHLDHGRTLGSTSESGCGAGGLRRRNKQWRLWVEPRSQGLHCAVCSMSCEPANSTLSGARAGSCWRVGEVMFPFCDDKLAVVDGGSRGQWVVRAVVGVDGSGGGGVHVARPCCRVPRSG
jgi:hypothetical protein